MIHSRESSECKQFKPSAEYSVTSLDGLNNDCLELIFQFLPLRDLLQLRYFCRSLNNAVCEHLRTSHRKLAVYLTRQNPTSGSNPKRDRKTLLEQSHFRWESFTSLNTPKDSPIESIEKKIASLVLFVTNRMSHITKLALLIGHDDYIWFANRPILAARALRVLFIDMAYKYIHSYWLTRIVDAISGIPELESLYFFRNSLDDSNRYSRNSYPIYTSSGDDFLGLMLRRLRVLHIHKMPFPSDITCDRLEELSLFPGNLSLNFRLNSYPVLRTLIDTSKPPEVFNVDDLSFLVNVKVLKIHCASLIISSHMNALNRLPNLTELHCRLVYVTGQFATTNGTITRLFTKYVCRDVNDSYRWDEEEEVSISKEKKGEYVEQCRMYFLGLQMLKNERPEVIVEF